MGICTLALLLMETIESKKTEMVHDVLGLAVPKIEDAALTVVHACLTPLVVVYVIGNLDRAITLSRDDHEHILQVLRQYLVLFVALEKGVQVVELILLLVRELGLQEAHLMHDHGHMVELQ